MTVFYRGSGQYCYANSMSMALQSVGEDLDPGYLECLTAVAISAFIDDNGLPFFSSRFNAPDRGINVALKNLGYEFQHYHLKSDDDPDGSLSLQTLEKLLQHGTVIAGPLDMGKLIYLPNHPFLGGVDHYVAVYKMDKERVYLHDPAGFPFMALTREEFTEAWKAESIGYRIGSYSMWGDFRKNSKPTLHEIFQKTEKRIQEVFLEEKQEGYAGSAAIRQLASQIEQGGLSDSLKGHLTFFSFQLGAKRCSDFAAFYGPYSPQKARLKIRQGEQFGAAHTALMKQDWRSLHQTLHTIADIEEELQSWYKVPGTM